MKAQPAVLLDAGPLGLVSNPKQSAAAVACNEWLEGLVAAPIRVLVPEITDYEVCRELLRGARDKGLARLDALCTTLEYLPLTTGAMRVAAEFWAKVRQQGRPTADDKALDADVILAAQAVTLGEEEVVVATTNVGHLGLLVKADLWQNIKP